MVCKKYKGLASKNVSENKAVLEQDNKNSQEIARKFKKGTKISKKL